MPESKERARHARAAPSSEPEGTGPLARALSALDHLAPSADNGDPRRAQHGRMIVRLSLLVSLLNLVIAPILYFTYETPQVAGINILLTCMLFATPTLLHRTGSIEVATHWILANAFAVLVYETILLGGVESPPFTWLIGLPLAASLLGGQRCAAFWGYATALTLVLLVSLQLTGWLGDGTLAASAVANRGLSTAMLAVLIAHFGRLQERQITELVRHLDDERTHFRLAATRDALTGLLNRSLLEDRLAGVLARSRRSQRPGAIYYADLDGFKQVNDRHGHHVGDLLLKAVAERLQSVTRASDSLLRVGGDEFVVLVEDVQDASTAGKLAEKFAACVTSPCRIEDRELEIGISIGVAMIDSGDASPQQLLHDADTAMYEAKRRGQTHFFA